MDERTVDVAGIPVRLRAPDPGRAASLAANLVGFPETDAEPCTTLTVVAAPPGPADAAPSRPPDDELLGMRFWRTEVGMAVVTGDLVLHARGAAIVAYQPDPADGFWLEELVAFALAWVLGAHARFVLHAAAVARDDRALLVLGHTGAGKSTLSGACLEAGWQLLGDDQVVIDASTTPVAVHGFHHSPAVPREIGGAVAGGGAVLGDPRDRAELPRAVLSSGGVPVVAVVLAGHSDVAAGELVPAAATSVFPLLLQSFPATVDPELRAAFFPVAGDLTRLPCFDLRHAYGPARREAVRGASRAGALVARARGGSRAAAARER